MSEQKTMARAEIQGRITTEPKLTRRSADNMAVCRFKVATEAGPASSPVVKEVWVVGDPAARPSEDLPVRVHSRLGIGCLVYVPGVEHQRTRKVRGVEFFETVLRAEDVKLREWARAGGGA